MRTPGLAVVRLGVSIGVAFVLTQAGVPVAAAATADPAGSLPISSCPAGSQLYLPVSSSLEANGWVDVRYDIGTAVDVEVPPLGKTSWSSMQVSRTYANAWTGAYSEPNQIKWNIVASQTDSTTSGISSGNTMSNTWIYCN